MNRMCQKGSAEIVIIAVLALGFLVAVGYIAWGKISHPTTTQNTVVSNSNPTATIAAKVKNYCTPLEKLCFDYPDDWNVVSHPQANTFGVSVDDITIADHNGTARLQLATGATGLGGVCGDDSGGQSSETVLKTQATKIAGSYLVSAETEAYVLPTVYAAEYILHDASSKTWQVHMELNNSKGVTKIGTVPPCTIGMDTVAGKNIVADTDQNSSDSHGAIIFDNGISLPGSTALWIYSSEAEAQAALATPEAQQAYDILLSAHY